MGEKWSKFKNLLDSATRNLSQVFFDDYQSINAAFRASSGLKTLIIRESFGKCCNWCTELEGTYEYGAEPKSVYSRHANCDCIVTFKSQKGYQDVHSKKQFQSLSDAQQERLLEIEERKYNALLFRSKPDSDASFVTYNNGKKDIIKPFYIRRELRKSEIGEETLKYITEEGIEIKICYGVDNPLKRYGYYDPIMDDIVIFGDVCETRTETALTIIHEVTHRKNRARGLSPFDDEFEAFASEKMHTNKNRQLTPTDVDDIIQLIEENYGFFK